MAQVDISSLNLFMPIFSFLLVFIIIYAVLVKTKIVGESNFVQLFVSFLIAIVFVLAVKPSEYVLSIVPWFAVMLVIGFLILALTGFVGGKTAETLNPQFGKALVYILGAIFIVVAFFSFSDLFAPYIPGGSGGNENVSAVTGWLFSSEIGGAIVLLIICALVSWVLIRAKK